MKKTFRFGRFIILIILVIGLFSCKAYRFDLEEWLDYWASQAGLNEGNLEALAKANAPITNGKDKNGVFCIKSDANKTIVFDIKNPKNFEFAEPVLKFYANGTELIEGSGITKGTDYEIFLGGVS